MNQKTADDLNQIYWRLYWAGDAENAAALVDFMRKAGIDCNGRYTAAVSEVEESHA